MPLDVLDDDDGVVDHAPDRDGERSEGDDVEGVPGGVHPDEGDENGCRDGDRCDEGGADRQQEDEDDDDREDQPQGTFDRQGLDRFLDERRLIEHDGELGPASERILKLRDDLLHRVRHRDGVSRGGLRDGDGERGFAVHARDAGDGVVDDGDCGDIRDAHSLAVGARRVHQGQRSDVGGGCEAHPRLNGEGLIVLGDRPEGQQRPVGIQGIADVLVGDAGLRQTRRVGRDGHALDLGAEEIRLSHSLDLLDVVQCRIFEQRREVLRGQVAGDGDLDDREVFDAAGDHLRVGPVGQSRLDAVDRQRDFLLNGRDLGAVGEGGRHGREVRVRGRGRVVETRDALDRRLDRRGHVFVHHLRCSARIGGDDHELREGDRRDELLLERRQGDGAEDSDDDRDQRDQRAVAQAEGREKMHQWSPGTADAPSGLPTRGERHRQAPLAIVSPDTGRA